MFGKAIFELTNFRSRTFHNLHATMLHNFLSYKNLTFKKKHNLETSYNMEAKFQLF